MRNFFYLYRQYIYLEKQTSINEIQIGSFYRLYNYKYEETGITENFTESESPILLVVGYDPKTKCFHTLKVNHLPLNRFMKILTDIQNPAFTKLLIEEIESKNKRLSDISYSEGTKAIKIGKTGRAFYQKTITKIRDLETYDTYRTYKKPNIKRIKELYFDLNKLKAKLGYKNYTTLND